MTGALASYAPRCTNNMHCIGRLGSAEGRMFGAMLIAPTQAVDFGHHQSFATRPAMDFERPVCNGSRPIAACRLREFRFKAVAKIVDIPWDIAVGNDLRHPRVKGARPVGFLARSRNRAAKECIVMTGKH
ncbi:hypothetical protein [Burkholderia sp. Ac-20365]|uniref:hypothetical protein n=1 Tax=Burkholderia sp. Ac-20365 TaxID=2703897 RepID=UPI00197B1FBE|nr:hypothetical protein [Burkholderia sp. Ac-20365]MBN3761715.1 hypothetical protein [Burkholderia sp. Ac-20365]